MNGITHADSSVLILAGITICVLLIWRLLVWIREAPVHPDPWGAEIERLMDEPEAVPVCHHCFTPCPTLGWFCEHCGAAVGPYNNYMPYIYVFSQGEVLRNGVMDRMRANPLVVIGYLLYSAVSYVIVAPVYWFFLFRNVRWRKDQSAMTAPGNPTL